MTENSGYEHNLLKRYRYWSLYLHENQSYLGRTYAALHRDGEIDPFSDTTVEEQAEFRHIAGELQEALDVLYQPTRLNYANLRNTWLHCHWHIIPRYDSARRVNGDIFYDDNHGHNYAPAPKNTASKDTIAQIKHDLRARLHD